MSRGAPMVWRTGKFLGDCEQTAVGVAAGRAERERGRGGKTSGGDAGVDPGVIYFGEEALDVAPTGALAGLAGLSDEHDEEIEAMAGGADDAVRAGAAALPKAARNWRRMAAGSASVCGAGCGRLLRQRHRAASRRRGFCGWTGRGCAR